VTMWEEFGFLANPYWTHPVTVDDEGTRLLLGRDSEVRQLLACLSSTSTHPTVEGALGVGKTSLVGVAGYCAVRDYREGRSPKLFVPMPKPIRLTSGAAVSDVKRRLYLDLSQACILWRDALLNSGFAPPAFDAVNYWMNHHSSFDESGFISTVKRWLRECFASQTAGGFICVIENLELLGTSRRARVILGALRDDLFNTTGLRCVLCGAKGMIRNVSSSSSLQGLFAEPIDLNPLPNDIAAEAVDRRVAERKISDRAYVPVDRFGFGHIYGVLNHSLRDSLKYSQDFAIWLHRQGRRPTDPEDKLELLKAWVADLADKYSAAARGIPKDAWQVFDEIVSRGAEQLLRAKLPR